MYPLLIVLMMFTSFKQQHPNYTIVGSVKGYADSSVMYLSDLSDGSYKDIDSVMILNERFRFKGKLNHPTVRFAIHSKDFKDRTPIWVAAGETTITAEKGKFRNALIVGSKAQALSYVLDSVISATKDQPKAYKVFIQKYPSSIVSADILKVYSSSWNKDTVSMLYQQLTGEAKNSIYGKQVLDFLTYNKSPKIGDPFVDFQQATMDGKQVKLSDYKGKVVLLEFWGSWCSPCREGHPFLIKTYNEFKDKGFEILGVAADTDKKILVSAIQNDGLPWQNVSDLKGDQNKAAIIYGVSYYPANFLIDKNGIIIAKDLRDEKLYQKLKELF